MAKGLLSINMNWLCYTSNMPIIGAHVSASGSLELSLDRAAKIGASATQIFISPPQQWAQIQHDEAEIQRYQQNVITYDISTNFIHGTYLVNLATQNPENLQKSINWLIYSQNMAAKLGIVGTIFHTGSHGGIGFEKTVGQIALAITKILENSPPNILLILENSAGMGGSIGSKFAELGQILQKVGDPRLKICLDTQHAFAAGYDLKSPMGIRSTLEEFNEEIGLENLVAVHANDSKVDLGAGKDRHENIGEGFIRKEGFENILTNPVFEKIPFILEVPGFSNSGPDKENIDMMHSLMLKIDY